MERSGLIGAARVSGHARQLTAARPRRRKHSHRCALLLESNPRPVSVDDAAPARLARAPRIAIRGRPGTGSINFWTDSTVKGGAWHTVAFTYDNGGLPTLYFDGVQAPITSTENGGRVEGAWDGSATTLEVGCGEGNYLISGTMQNVRVSNVIMSWFPGP